METAEKIKTLRLLNGCDQQLLAERLEMRSATTINRWEQRVSLPRTGMLMKLGQALGINWPWLQDSRMPLVKDNFVQFVPLSPYVDYSDRWGKYVCSTLPALFMHLCLELGISKFWSLDAPCRGGITIAAHDHLVIEIISAPELHAAIQSKLPEHMVLQIADSEFLEELCEGTRTVEFFAQCGIDWVKAQARAQEPPSKPSISLRFNVEMNNNDDGNRIKGEINNFFKKLIQNNALYNVKFDINITPSRTSNELMYNLIVNKQLKKAAKKLLKNGD